MEQPKTGINNAPEQRPKSEVAKRFLRKYKPRGRSRKAPEASGSDSIQRSEREEKERKKQEREKARRECQEQKKIAIVGKPWPNTSIKVEYIDVVSDYDGWVEVEKFLPREFDLVHTRVLNSLGQRFNLKLWYACGQWDGLKWRDTYKVTHWKRPVYGQES